MPALVCAGALAVAALGCAGTALASDKHAALLLDANSGQVLYQSAADAPRHPASLAKIMTLYLTFELIDRGKLDYQTRIKMTEHAAGVAPSKLDLEPGEEIALVDAIKALITKSANDVAVALAEHIAGSEERFAQLMTQKARQLGMAATTFRNASGLPDDEQVTTARDMATLALRLQEDFPRHYALFSTRTFTYKGETFRNHNTLLFHYDGTDGVKTGYTRASGFNLVSSVRRGRKHVIGVVFGGSTAAARNTTMRTLLNLGLAKGSTANTRKPEVVARAPVARERKMAEATPRPPQLRAPPVLAKAPSPPPAATAPFVPAQAAPEAATSPVRTDRIEMARVKPVLIGESSARRASTDTFPAPDAIEALLARSLPSDTAAAGSGSEPQPALFSGKRPAPRETAMPMATGAPPNPTLIAEPTIVRGAPPSTLEQQAADLARGETSATGPGAASLAPRGAAMQIQIGAFSNVAEAERRLALARERAPGAIGERPALTRPVRQGGKLFYRARFDGFDAQAAALACKELRGLKMDCLVTRPE